MDTQTKNLLDGAVRLGLDEQELITTANAVIDSLFGGDESNSLVAMAEAIYYVSQGGVRAVAELGVPMSKRAIMVLESYVKYSTVLGKGLL